jgi:hypothetical protein
MPTVFEDVSIEYGMDEINTDFLNTILAGMVACMVNNKIIDKGKVCFFS